MSITPEEQETLIDKWLSWRKGETSSMDKLDQVKAERVIQIRNSAAIIQSSRPDVIVLNEFNNDGAGSELTLNLFQKNYLSHGQYLDGTNKGKKLEPISYPFAESYATNTGRKSGFDLANDGIIDNQPEDAVGFGYYHGHYAFAFLHYYQIMK